MRVSWKVWAVSISMLTMATFGQGADWVNGFPTNDTFFPLAVWLQNPANAQAYKNLGINTYVGLWDGPTEAQLSALKAAGIHVVCAQNDLALASPSRDAVKAWMHGDEPDNAQPDGSGGYDPPILPEVIVADYVAITNRDPSRPVLLNLGQGVAWDGWYGRGVRTDHPEDYPEYVKGCDIVSFDIYPVTATDDAIRGNLWYVGYGVERLVNWTEGLKPVWNCIEVSHIGSTVLPTPAQIRSEVWMSIIHGSRGIIYFVHEWYPSFSETGLLRYPELMQGVQSVNAQIMELAPVLNSPTVIGAVDADSSNPDVPLKTMVKRHGGATYLLVVAMRDGNTTASFDLAGLSGSTTAEVLGESRTIPVSDGAFQDGFAGYGVHLYRVSGTSSDTNPPTISSAASADPNPVMLPAGTTVHVAASDPDGDSLTYAWSKVSGLGAVTFAAPTGTTSAVTFGAAGTYLLRVTVDDGHGGMATSEVTVVVNEPELRITGVGRNALPGEFIISWQSVTGRRYTVQATTNLLGGFTLNLCSNILAIPPENVYTDSVTGAECKFYRVVEQTVNDEQPTRANTGPRTTDLVDMTPLEALSSYGTTVTGRRITGNLMFSAPTYWQHIGPDPRGKTYTFVDCEIQGMVFIMTATDHESGNGTLTPDDLMVTLNMSYCRASGGISSAAGYKGTIDHCLFNAKSQWAVNDTYNPSAAAPGRTYHVLQNCYFWAPYVTQPSHYEVMQNFTKVAGLTVINCTFEQQGGPLANTGITGIINGAFAPDNLIDHCYFLWDGAAAAYYSLYAQGSGTFRNCFIEDGTAYLYPGSQCTFTNCRSYTTGNLLSLP